jgi:hypothetical protein
MRSLALVAALAGVALAEAKLDDAEAEMAKADEYAAKKDYVAALAHYNAARMIAPDKPGPYFKLGMTYALTGDCKQAIPNLEQYVKLKGADAHSEAVMALDGCKAKQAPPPAACPDGQIKSTDTAGHCCWPAQVWSSDGHCVGEPQCPAGFTLGPRRKACQKSAGCPPGKVQSQVAGQCCWPGQGYSHEKSACIGDPLCPDGMLLQAGDCVADPRPDVPPRPQIADVIKRAQPMVRGCRQRSKLFGQAVANFVLRSDGKVQTLTIDGELAGTPLAVCLQQALRTLQFAPFKRPTVAVSWPFTFR